MLPILSSTSNRVTNHEPISDGETVIDNHALIVPTDLPPAAYTHIIGLYDMTDPQARLAVGDGDYLKLGTIEIAENN